MTTFDSLGIASPLTRILSQRSITEPTPIQAQAIPIAVRGDDVIGIAQTGTGKTLAFMLPYFQQIATAPKRALIVLPTRELAQQVVTVGQWFTKPGSGKAALLIGGESMHWQTKALRNNPSMVVATPGRLLDHVRQKHINLKQFSYIVLDEADRMFDMGFAPQIKAVMAELPPGNQRQTLLFSATMPSSIAGLVKQYIPTPVRIEVASPGDTARDIQQELIVVNHMHKKEALFTLLKSIKTTVLIFSRTKFQAKHLVQELREKGYRTEELHSNRSQAQRTKALSAIRSKSSQILVATDIAARGIDISHIETVINYDLPEVPEDYVHRIGRTGRAGRSGKAISLVVSDQGQQIRRIQQLIKQTIPQVEVAGIPKAQLQQSSMGSGRRSFGGRSGFGGRRGGRPSFRSRYSKR